MKVYVVMGGWVDMGETSMKLKVFATEESARAYEKELLDIYDFVTFKEEEVVE